jgi:transcriptional regulator GlxA family with amidase domain
MLDDPLKCAVMGTAARREVLFQALRGPRANTLISLIRYASTDERIDRAMTALRENFAATVSVNDLAKEAGMSVSTFHRAFKQKTGHSPIQYLKLIRLHYARRLLAFETHKIGEIARVVGYESVSQFGREYRRVFNEPPSAVRDNTTRLPLSVSDSMNFNFPTRS